MEKKWPQDADVKSTRMEMKHDQILVGSVILFEERFPTAASMRLNNVGGARPVLFNQIQTSRYGAQVARRSLHTSQNLYSKHPDNDLITNTDS